MNSLLRFGLLVMASIFQASALADAACDPFGTISVMDGRYIVQNNVWNATSLQCVTTTDSSRAGFLVSTSTHSGDMVAAYPSVFKGCHWALCTRDSGMPILASQIASAPVSLKVTPAPTYRGNVAAEAWLSPRAQPDADKGYEDGLELMIWIDSDGLDPAGERIDTVTLGGTQWEVWLDAPKPERNWTYVVYRHDGLSEASFDLMDFMNDSASRGYLDPSFYLHVVEAGTEIVTGGAGFSVDEFSLLVVPKPSSSCNEYDVEEQYDPLHDIMEYKFACAGFHFGTLLIDELDNEGRALNELVFRPHPSTHDVNAWGTSWFMAPFFPGPMTQPRSASIDQIVIGDDGIHVDLSGRIADLASESSDDRGDWTLSGIFAYDNGAKKVSSTGLLSVSADDSEAMLGDLNLDRLSSNFMHDVPLQGQDGYTGDTGDMSQAIARYGDPIDATSTWNPAEIPVHYPTDAASSLEIELVGQFNDVDIVALGGESPIAKSFKPTVQLAFSTEDALLSAGFSWDEREPEFDKDNIGINHLVLSGNLARPSAALFQYEMASYVRPLSWQVTEIYIATLGYAPDDEGLQYWVDEMESGDWTANTVAMSFFDQPLVQDQYPTSLGYGPLIDTLYNNIFGRDPDPEGYAYWLGELESGRLQRNQVIIALIDGGWANPDAERDMTRFRHRVQVGLAFAAEQAARGIVYSSLTEEQKADLRQLGQEVLATVTDDTATRDSAIARIAALLAELAS